MSILVRNVNVDGVWWGPAWGNADQVPAEVAARITNPKAWDGGKVPGADPWPGVPSYEEGARAAREAERAQDTLLPPAPATDVPHGDLDALRGHARSLGITVDGRWGRRRLLTEIENATPARTSET